MHAQRRRWQGLEGVRHADDVFWEKLQGSLKRYAALRRFCTLDGSRGPFISRAAKEECVCMCACVRARVFLTQTPPTSDICFFFRNASQAHFHGLGSEYFPPFFFSFSLFFFFSLPAEVTRVELLLSATYEERKE